jgi:hypothetical protein
MDEQGSLRRTHAPGPLGWPGNGNEMSNGSGHLVQSKPLPRIGRNMSEKDILKEKIAYLKLWLGIFAVTDISLIGWLITQYESAKPILIGADAIAILSMTVAIFVLHKRIEREIERSREL